MDDNTGLRPTLASARNVRGPAHRLGGLTAELVGHWVASPPAAAAQ
jgi:hypothetical protein